MRSRILHALLITVITWANFGKHVLVLSAVQTNIMVKSANKTLHWIDHQRGSGGRWSFVRGVQPVNLVVYNAPNRQKKLVINGWSMPY